MKLNVSKGDIEPDKWSTLSSDVKIELIQL